MKRPLVLFIVLASFAVAAIAVWRIQDTRANEHRIETETLKGLSAEDIRVVLASQANSSDGIPEDVETRRTFLKGMREYLALAAAARREGMTEDPAFRINFEHKKNILLADLYQAKLSKETGTDYKVLREALDAVWKDPANEKQFELDMSTLRDIQSAVARERGETISIQKLEGGSLVKARDNWSRVKILSDMAKNNYDFMSQPVIRLRTRILEAGILSADYLRKHWSKVTANEADIADYLSRNPHYSVAAKRAKAEALLQRVRAGEDFASLASQFSEDRTTKIKGGLHENLSQGVIWEDVEKAALALDGQGTVDRLVETETGFHIVKLENKKVSKDAEGKEVLKFSLRHILIQRKFEDPQNMNPDIPSPFLSPEEIAKAAVEIEKRNAFVEQVLQKYDISLPEDFAVKSVDNTITWHHLQHPA